MESAIRQPAPTPSASTVTRPAVSCPACHVERAAPPVLLTGHDRMTGAGGRFTVVACQACGLAFTEPRLREEDFAIHYPETYEAYVPRARLRSGSASPGELLDRLRLEAIVRYGPYRSIWKGGPCRLLDVGCASGDLAAVFARHGYEVCGVEPSAAAAELARGCGLSVHTGTIDDAPWADASFDAIVFNHSLEHIEDPGKALARAARLLRPGGLLTIAVPNFGSWHRRVFASAWFQLDLPRHLQHFDRGSLIALLRSAGFRPLKVGAASMRPSLLGSLQHVAFGRMRFSGRGFRVLTWALMPLLSLPDLVADGDCLHVTAER